MDRESEIEPDEVGVLHRPERGKTETETFLDDAVDGRRVTDARVHERERLAPERVLEAVADKARDVAADVHRRLPRLLEKIDRPSYDMSGPSPALRRPRRAGRGTGDSTSGCRRSARDASIARDVGDSDHRRVRGEHRFGGREPIELGEQALFQLDPLGRGLENEVCVGNRVCQRRPQLDGGGRRRVSASELEVASNPLGHGREHVRVGVLDSDDEPLLRERLSDPVAHEAGTDDCDTRASTHQPAV